MRREIGGKIAYFSRALSRRLHAHVHTHNNTSTLTRKRARESEGEGERMSVEVRRASAPEVPSAEGRRRWKNPNEVVRIRRKVDTRNFTH